ncbi:MAG: T9SS type A sorting domain-containing protein [Parabacteroides sp.]|nr:T9SS type A sorting domain-containing protein [Parabacteroides sp.]
MSVKRIYKWSIILLCLLFCGKNTDIVFGQVKGNKYQSQHPSFPNNPEGKTSDRIIYHKPAKWFELRKQLSEASKKMDTFSDDIKMFDASNTTTLKNAIQATHTYIDTIFVHKGTEIVLELPDQMGGNSSVRGYQRWYNFRTQKNFETDSHHDYEEEVWDLLTPLNNQPGSRFINGYIGAPINNKKHINGLKSMSFYFPKDEEFEKYNKNKGLNPDNNFYIIACDVSSYKDFTQIYTSSSKDSLFYTLDNKYVYEPTLAHRVIFYIHAVEDENLWYTKALKNQSNDSFVYEYNINLPYIRINDGITRELLSIPMSAKNFVLPIESSSDHERLDVKIDQTKNTAGLKLYRETETLTGLKRVIQIAYPNTDRENTRMQRVNYPNSKSSVLVTKTVNGKKYNLVRFNLTFQEGTQPLTQSQIKCIDEGKPSGGTGVWNTFFPYRTPSYLNKNFQLLTSLNFDYDPAVSDVYGQNGYYPFPLSWESNSYAFFDGASNEEYFPTVGCFPEWGFYSILSKGMSWDNNFKPLPNSNYHLYVDASDRPGNIAVLPFKEKLCRGTELFVSGWMKSASGKSVQADASIIFTIVGVETIAGKKRFTPIYTHSSGQIPRTDKMSQTPIPGVNNNEWFQIFFSFVNETDVEYESYALQINNNCASTNGGDMYIDDVRVYMARPTAEVKQLKATCNTRTPMNIRMNWKRLLSRTGEKEITDAASKKEGQITYCFIDKWYYDQLRSEGKSEEDAINLSLIETGDTLSGHNHVYLDMKYNLNYSLNEEYLDNGNCTGAKSDHHFYRYTDESGQRFLTVDFSASIIPNRPYMMLISTDNKTVWTPGDFKFEEDLCAINTSFVVSGQNVIRMNGEIVNPTVSYCAGQMFDFKPQMKVSKDDENEVIIEKGIYYDWFFGTESEYKKLYPGYNVSVHDALFQFRENYKDVTSIDESITPQGYFTQEMLDLLKFLQNTVEESGLHPKLVLHQSNLSVTLQPQGLALIVQPISLKEIPDYPNISSLVCWEYIPITLKAEGKSPELHAGFDYIKYPEKTYEPSLRIGLHQIKNADASKPEQDRISIKIPLRGADVNMNGYYLGRVVSTYGLDKVFLVGSDDPALQGLFDDEFNQYDYPVGTIEKLYAKEYGDQPPGEVNFTFFVDINFDLSEKDTEESKLKQFVPHEGFTYTLMLPFEEKVENSSFSTLSEGIGTSCYGQLIIPMKVVPEYLVWAGKALDNWHNDKNWKRADKAELNKPIDDIYLNNENNGGDNGFVPMDFSKVIFQEGSKAELYWADFYGTNIWKTERPPYLNLPTDSIQYDLVAHSVNNVLIKTEGRNERLYLPATTYRVNVCNQIHFEPKAELLHPELLYYERAWIDYKLSKGKWYQLASPLKNVYSGDWYTGKNGMENSELFKDISYLPGDNSRFSPAVYQRGWSGNTQLKTADSQTKNVAVEGNWSSVYNDVAVPYLPGQGFSLKVVHSNDDVIFRLPKSDSQYEYESLTKSNMNLDRNSLGKLVTDDFWKEGNDDTQPFTLEMQKQNENSPYYLVGNPFTAHLDAETFFKGNGHLQKKYWLVDENGNQLIAVDGENAWTTTNGEAALIAPFTSFFVQKKDASDLTDRINIVDNMQRIIGGGEGPGKQTASAFTLVVHSANGKESRASVCYDMFAAAGYKPEEDAELFLDSNLSDIPAVYTVAGTMATSVNRTSDISNIPIGIYSRTPGQVSLTVEGAENMNSAVLYDAVCKKEIPLYNGCLLSLDANNHGRYFLRAAASVSTEPNPEHIIRVYNIGEMLVVASTENIDTVRIIDFSGRIVFYKKNICSTNIHINITSGNYIVEVKSKSLRKTIKVNL